MQSEKGALSGLTVVLCSDPIGNIWTSQSFKTSQRAVCGDKTRNATMTYVSVVYCSDPILLLEVALSVGSFVRPFVSDVYLMYEHAC